MTHPKKVVLLGHFGVGKTSLLRRFVDDAFSEDYLVTVGVHVKKKDVTIGDETVSLILWDIEGNTSIDMARNSYLLGTHGFIYVFDITRPETYQDIVREFAYLDEKFPEIPVCLVGNKADQFDASFTQEFFKEDQYKACFFTSAKTGEQVDELFNEIASRTL